VLGGVTAERVTKTTLGRGTVRRRNRFVTSGGRLLAVAFRIGVAQVLIAVAGSSGLGPIAGLSTAEPAALLRAVRAEPTSHVVLLAPRYATSMAREQAHITIAAEPDIRVSVLPFDHHALMLTLTGTTVLQLERVAGGWSDPGEAVQLLMQAAARSRSLVWYPSVFGLRDPPPTWNHRVHSLLSRHGYITELGPAANLEPGLIEPSGRSDANWFATAEVPRRVHAQPAAAPWVVPVRTDRNAPYATKTSVELAALVAPVRRAITTARCSACSVGRTAAGCAFCGAGPHPGWALTSAPAERSGKRAMVGGGTR
jgi:hypothetical protein